MTITATKVSHLRETRALASSDLSMRSNTDGTLTFTGYASVFNTDYRVQDMLGEYDERVAPGAFTKALQESDDVRLLVNHEGVPLARTKSGTLVLREDEVGLHCEARLDPLSPLVQTVRSAMSRGDLDQMSFAFSVVRQSWSADYGQRTINEARLFDVSVVTYPASPSTSADLRQAALRSAAKALPEGRLAELLVELRAGRTLSGANLALLESVLDTIRQAAETVEDAGEVLETSADELADFLIANGSDVPVDPDAADEVGESSADAAVEQKTAGLHLSMARAKARR